MRHLLFLATKKTTILSALLIGGLTSTMAQPFNVLNRGFVSNTLPTATPPPDVLRVQNGLLSHDGNPQTALNTGTPTLVGTFGANAKWIGIGAPVTPGNLLYGERTQWNEQAFIKALRQRSTTDVIKDAILEWGGGIAAQAGSEMQFRHITNPTSPTGFTRILTMRTNGNSYFGTTAPVGTQPRMGVGTTDQRGFASTTTNNMAGFFRSLANLNGTTLRGVWGTVIGGNFTGGAIYGVAGVATGTTAAGRAKYGIYGRAPVSANSYAGFFQGDVFSTSQFIGSDAKYKINVVTETNALSKILAVRPVVYNFDTIRFRDFNFSPRRQHGFIAQELQAILPEAVQTARLATQDEEGNETGSDVGLSLNYINLISILYRGIQEQQAQINELRQRLGLPPVTAASPATSVSTGPTSISGNRTADPSAETDPAATGNRISTSAGEFSVNDFKMEQNVPNPFNGSTVIRYSLPNGIRNAFIGIYNLQGTQLQRYDRLNGTSQITVNANNLQPGIYIYALVAEGQEVMSKRMVLNR
jgi:hypothetical protein